MPPRGYVVALEVRPFPAACHLDRVMVVRCRSFVNIASFAERTEGWTSSKTLDDAAVEARLIRAVEKKAAEEAQAKAERRALKAKRAKAAPAAKAA